MAVIPATHGHHITPMWPTLCEGQFDPSCSSGLRLFSLLPSSTRGVDRRIRASKGPHRRRRDRTRASYGRGINLNPAGVDTYGRIGRPSIRASRHTDRCIHDCRRRWSTHGTRHCLPHCHRCRIDLGVGHYKVPVESLNFLSLSWPIFPSWYNRATALAIVL